jgi:pSer/pThr/pTyr-binding forkhead associated (FHA) protein
LLVMPGQSSTIAVAATPTLVPTGACGDQPEVLLDRATLLVGAKEGCDLQLAFSSLSDIHALIVTAREGVFIRNLIGPGGVLVNGQPVREQLLCDGDEVRMAGFECRFKANQASFRTPAELPPWEFEFNGALIPRVPGRTMLIGAAPDGDAQIGGQGVSPRHALLLAADGKWKIRDLASEGGTFVNGKSVVNADLETGDVLQIGSCRMTVGKAAPRADGRHEPGRASPPQASDSFPPAQAPYQPAIHQGESFLGGMPVSLPEITLPKNFGKVGVSFGGKTFGSKLEPSLAESRRTAEPEPPPKRDEFVAVNTGQAAVADAPDSAQEADLPAISPVLAKFPVVPKRKISVVRSEPEEIGDEGDPQEQTLIINDAPFGGVAIGGSVAGYDSDSQAMSELFADETESFCQSAFWDGGDEAQLAPPERASDSVPYIPPTAAPDDKSAASVGESFSTDKPHGGNGRHRPGVMPPSTAAVALAAPTAPRRSGKRRRHRLAVLNAVMASVMLGATAAIWLVLPTHETLDGRLTYINAPAAGTAQWRAFQDDQRGRLADSSLQQASLQSLQDDHPGAEPGFLADPSGKAFAALVGSARFDQGGLVLEYHGTDEFGDMQRVAAVLKAIYVKDADLNGAVADARKALDDWEPRVNQRKDELASLQFKMDELRKVIDAARGVGETLGPLREAASQAGKDYAAAERSVQADQWRLDEIDQSLSSAASASSAIPATRPAMAAGRGKPSTRPSGQAVETDLELGEIQQQITDISEQISSPRGAAAGAAMAKQQQVRAAAKKRLDAAMSAAASVLRDHPDIALSLNSAGQLQGRIDALIDQLAQIRQAQENLLDMRGLIEQTGRSRQRIIDDSDARLRQIGAQLDAAERQYVLAQALADAPATRPTTAPSADIAKAESAPEAAIRAAAEARRKVDDIQTALVVREQQLLTDDSARLRDRIGRLIDDGDNLLTGQRQLIVDTLSTLSAGLDAMDIPADLTADDKALLAKVTQSIRDLMQSQNDAAGAIAQIDPAAASQASLGEQLAELKSRAEARRRILSAAAPADDAERARLTDQRQAAASRLATDRAAMETARQMFISKAMASADAALTVATARKAEADLDALISARDAKASDLQAMQRSRDDLAQRIQTTVEVKRPADADVSVVADDTMRKVYYNLAAIAGIGVIFGVLMGATRRSVSAVKAI